MTAAARRTVLLAWLWVALCIAVILTLSGESFSGVHTWRYLTWTLRWFDPETSWATIHRVHHLLRKGAHAFEYAVLGVLAFRALRLSLALSVPRIGLLTAMLVLAVAGTDELRQSLLDTRTGSPADVALDFGGGLVGVLAIIALHRLLGVRAPGGAAP